jgi:hypothetical protein
VPLADDRANSAQAQEHGCGQAGQAAADDQDRAVPLVVAPLVIAPLVSVCVDDSLPY